MSKVDESAAKELASVLFEFDPVEKNMKHPRQSPEEQKMLFEAMLECGNKNEARVEINRHCEALGVPTDKYVLSLDCRVLLSRLN